MPGSPRGLVLRDCLADPLLDVMNFLNEAVSEFPAAISFAPGRPRDALFTADDHAGHISTFVSEAARRSGASPDAVWRELGQYSRTNGIVADIVATHLARDEGIHVDPSAVIITAGAQEAMALVLVGLFEPGRDVLLVSDPTYVGITGLARLLGIRVASVPAGDDGLDPGDVARAVARESARGRVRALYCIPDFNNPLGTCLPLARRLALLDVCVRNGVLVVEDNAYGMFAYDHERLPTLKALDRATNVMYIGSFSKTLFPGLRVGYLVADQPVAPDGHTLATALSRVKSLVTVNTPPLMQAVVGGVLLQNDWSLEPVVGPKRAHYREQRDAMLAALGHRFADPSAGVSWKAPAGGFFLSMTLPFAFGRAELRRCAADYGVIVSPMQFFCIHALRQHQIRLSFSYVTPPDIHEGVRRLAAFIHDVHRHGRASRAPAARPDDRAHRRR